MPTTQSRCGWTIWISPDGGRILYDYLDALAADSAGRYHSSIVTSTKLDSTRYIDSKAYFDGRGALTQTFDRYTTGDGWSITDIEYDSMGRPWRASNPYYCTTSYGTCAINPSGIWTSRTYDVLGRVTEVTMPRGDDSSASATTTVQTAYAGDVITVSDQAGKQRRQITDALGRLIRLDEPTSAGLGAVGSPNQITEYQYDVLDNLVKITQDSQSRYFKYDSLSRLIRERHVEQIANSSYNLSDSLTGNSSWTAKLEYNSQGLITQRYDARGVRSDLYYDTLNRLTLIDYSDSTPDARYYYDDWQNLPSGAPSFTDGLANGRLVGMTYGSSSSTTGTYFGYDSMGQVNVQKQVTGSNTYSLSYSYNLAGLLATQTYPTNRVLTHSYDNAGRLAQISDGTTTFSSGFTYAASGGLLSETWGNGAVHSIAYNNALQVSQIKLKQSSAGSELQRYDYLYGQVTQTNGSIDKSKNNGQIGRIDGFINGSSTKEWEQRFSYDDLGRVSTASEYQQGTGSTPTWKQEFSYDRYGNRFQSGSGNTGMSFVSVVSSEITAATNRFIASGSTPVTYDEAGNIIQDAKFRSMNYTYDANGRQLSATAIGGSPSQTSVYDCIGQRVQTTSGGVTRTMVYDAFGQQVADYSGTTVQRENIYRGEQLLAVNEASSGLSFVLTDLQGSTRALMNNSGSGSSIITSRRDYLPFGEEIGANVGLRTTTQKYSQSDSVRSRFAMAERDDVSGLDHTWFRKHESRAGRWTSPDPYGGSMTLHDPQSLNRYSYVENDPINLADPTGLMPCLEVVDPETGKTECISLPPESVTVTISRVDRLIESRGADHGVDYGLWTSLSLRGIRQSATKPKVCPPTGEQLKNDPNVIKAMERAWRESNPGMRDGVRREQGGWIYARNGRIFVIRAPAGQSGSINLNNPPKIRGALLVANFHTHPGFAAQGYSLPGPSFDDDILAKSRNLPALLISEGMKISSYGPERRGADPLGALDPKKVDQVRGYPGDTEDTSDCP